MSRLQFSSPLLALAVLFSASSFAVTVAEAKSPSKIFRASAETIRKNCNGTFLGTNKDGFYGCIKKDHKTVVTCNKKGRCVEDPAGRTLPGSGFGVGTMNTGGTGGMIN